MITKKFWCHYLGSDGNTPKRRKIELTKFDLVPAFKNDGATILWYEKEIDNNYSTPRVHYALYAQLSDEVAVYTSALLSEEFDIQKMTPTDKDLDDRLEARFQKHLEEYPDLSEVGKQRERELLSHWRDDEKEGRDDRLRRLNMLKDFTHYLLNKTCWIKLSELAAYKEVNHPKYPELIALRKKFEAQREEERKRRAEEREAERKAEEERKKKEAEEEEKRLTEEEEKFKNGEMIDGDDVVALSRKYGLNIHLRTVHNLQQYVSRINGKGQSYCSRNNKGKYPTLTGCFNAAYALFEYLNNKEEDVRL